MPNLSTGTKRHRLSERRDDLYETPPAATRALLTAEPFNGTIWEPACGPGAIVTVLREAGHRVYATDLIDYGLSDSEAGIDFLLERQAPGFHIGAIVTNPPFKLATEFVTHALELGIPKVAMLLRLAFLESDRRIAILDGGLLARIHVFRRRLPMMHRSGWEGPKTNSAMAFAWFVWELGHKGPSEIHRISWEAA
jgi:hypothetical protein